MGSIDTVSPGSREFYEYTKGKFVISMFYGLLAFAAIIACASWAANVSANDNIGLAFLSWRARQNQLADWTNGISEAEDANNDLQTGFGFGAFFGIIAFIFMVFGGIYYSPLVCGSPNEKMVVKNGPVDIEGVDNAV
jgi:hypothetical protein